MRTKDTTVSGKAPIQLVVDQVDQVVSLTDNIWRSSKRCIGGGQVESVELKVSIGTNGMTQTPRLLKDGGALKIVRNFVVVWRKERRHTKM